MRASRLLLVSTFVLGLVAAGTALGRVPGVPVASLSLAFLAAFGWLVLATERTSTSLRDLKGEIRTTRELRKPLKDALSSLRRLETELSRVAGQTHSAEHTVSTALPHAIRRIENLMTAVERTPGATVELQRAYTRLITDDAPMPDLGGWAATPTTIIWLVDFVGRTDAKTIVECGSGSSTVWLAAALERRGGEGHIWSLDGSEEFAAATRAQLERHGLAHRATVLGADHVTTPLPDRDPQPWYDVSGLADVHDIDLLFVDGPVGAISREARYPAVPVLADRLADGCSVLLDDAAREDEKRIIETWTSSEYAGRTLSFTGYVDRSVLMTVSRG